MTTYYEALLVGLAAITLIWLFSMELRYFLLNRRIIGLQAQGDALMSTAADFAATLAALNDATNELAAVVADLRNQIKSNLTAEEEDAIKAQLDAVASRLQALAAPAADPTPPAEEPPVDPNA